MGFWMILSISIAIFDSDLRFPVEKLLFVVVLSRNNIRRSSGCGASDAEKSELLTQHRHLLLWLHKAAGLRTFY